MTFSRRHLLAAAGGLLLAAAAAAAPPEGAPVRLINGFAAGGSSDIVARALAEKLRPLLQRPVVVENRTGAAGQLAVLDVKNAEPDGLTLLLTPSSPVGLYPFTFPKLRYVPQRDLAPIGRVTTFDYAVTAAPNVPARNVAELVAWLKQNPSKANYGTAGAGTLLHFTGLRLGEATGVDLVHVPYRGGSAALVDLLGGNITLMVDSPLPTIEAHRQGKARILAVTGPQRSPQLPEVPTLRESGVDFVVESYIAVFGPANLAPELVQQLNAAVRQAVSAPDFRERVAKLGMQAAPSSPDELRQLLVRDGRDWGPVVRRSGFVGED